MSTNRILKRSSEKDRIKGARKKLKSLEKTVNNLSKKCLDCSLEFNPKDDSMLDSWMVKVVDGLPTLRCPSCFIKHQSESGES